MNRPFRYLSTLTACFFLLLVTTFSAIAQSFRGSINGTVADASGAVIAGAAGRVTVRSMFSF